MLDTNMASYVIKGHPPEARERLAALPMDSILISAVTQAELLYGLARKGHPAAFGSLIKEFLRRVQVLPWDSAAAAAYGDLRASCAASGVALGALDMLIAAHAVATKSILVTHDKAFRLVPEGILAVEDWINAGEAGRTK
ncbi:MAG: type II toxin-antitoxin system VapC family toxin [Azoarcus sp.]|jgi:tRNA(fMet)-specific endonuclease VapC|nr:type II toxin-antitoxin system VapC family toxin [Azoarcus sp.]